MIKVENILNKGRGIIATAAISKGTLIECVPVASFQAKQWEYLNKTDLFKYCFADPECYSAEGDTDGYIVFGLSSLCNHSPRPNARIHWIQRETGLWADLVALSNIQPGEEISIFYTNIDRYASVKRFV